MVLTYHTHPPFVVGPQQGLTYDLAAYLTAHANGRYVFEVREMSRPALDKSLDMPLVSMVPWVHPVWFNDPHETRYLWSPYVFMQDATAVISRRDRPVVYQGPASLAGMIFGGLKGHVYAGIDAYIRETQALRRVDADNHLENFQKLLKRRIDVTLIPESAVLYLMKQEGLADQLFVSPHPHSQFTRRFFVTQQRADLCTYLNQTLSAAATQPAWQALLKQYR
jgi:polar amino acid transport system substrate-binding protein